MCITCAPQTKKPADVSGVAPDAHKITTQRDGERRRTRASIKSQRCSVYVPITNSN